MGSYSCLGIGDIEIDLGKNDFFPNHSDLFQSKDLISIPYSYGDIDDNGDEIIMHKTLYSKTLYAVKKRLDLLGYDLKTIEEDFYIYKEYEESLSNQSFNLTFEDFFKLISEINIKTNDDPYHSTNFLRKYTQRLILNIPKIKKQLSDMAYSFYIEEFALKFDTYSTLRILAENPSNDNINVFWDFTEVMDNGWIIKEDIECNLSQDKKILIVTEGTSNSFIIKKAINQLFPNISDFFEFIDMNKNYPFTGTGNLYNFCKGLAKINIQNNVLIVFDNDTAGNEKYRQALELEKPKNLCFCTLPDLEEMKKMKCLGPTGFSNSDINGRAVSIECFLDFNSIYETPYIHWTNFNKTLNQYQGSIEPKDIFTKKLSKVDLNKSTYGSSKLIILIKHLISSCVNR